MKIVKLPQSNENYIFKGSKIKNIGLHAVILDKLKIVVQENKIKTKHDWIFVNLRGQ